MSREELGTRDRILTAAWKLLEEQTGGGVRMSDIAKAAGISRQALYLHFPNRADLLVATTRYLDEALDTEARLKASRSADTGTQRLDAFIEAWGGYIPEVYGVAKALLAMKETDSEARIAWDDRMRAVRQGCRAAVDALEQDGMLSPQHSVQQSTDILWTLLSVRNWEQLVIDCGWSHQHYIDGIKRIARNALVRCTD